jgi:hypothetical protein|tara:strand:+ start:1098 stop:1763 length:666 start_codon:yes stop_codon:yes gene_type:complete
MSLIFKLEMSDTMTLARQINKANIAKIARNSFSPKSRSMQYAESLNETYICLSLDFDPTVKSYTTQPDSFFYCTDDGKRRRYTPDLLIQYTNGAMKFVEIKPEGFTHSDAFKQQFKRHQEVILSQTGCPLILITDVMSKPEKRKQFSQLKGYLNTEPLPDVDSFVIDYVKERGTCVIADIETQCVRLNAPLFYPMSMIARGLLCCSHDGLISRQCLVEVAS